MKRSRFSGQQIAFILRRPKAAPSKRSAGRLASAKPPIACGERKYDGLMPSEMKRLRQLEEENAKLKKLVARQGNCCRK